MVKTIEIVIKRSGEEIPFNREKIKIAIIKAMRETDHVDESLAENIAEEIENSDSAKISVEEIQDKVEELLMRNGFYDVAKTYIRYRYKHEVAREFGAELIDIYKDLTFKNAKDNDIARENANIDGNTSMGTMLKYGSESAKKFNLLYLMKPEYAKAHIGGDIHIHDLDFMALTTTCCQIDLSKLFENGFSTGHGFLRTPNSIGSYAALAAIAIQANQNDQHGGQSIPAFDTFMAPGVQKTYQKKYFSNLEKILTVQNPDIDVSYLIDKLKSDSKEKNIFPTLENSEEYFELESEILKDKISEDDIKTARKLTREYAEKETNKETYQAMEGFIHNLNTMNSRSGGQVPFSSVTLGDDISPEARMATKNFLLATEAGLGNGETAIFPVSIFRVKEGINYNPDDPNYDLFKLAMKVSAKRLFPNFCFADASFNIGGYDANDYNTKVAYMGKCKLQLM